ncbi:MAG: hypothetical protein M1838_005405, partial [Thelocarpon superellum]
MVAGSMVMASTRNPDPSLPLTNGHLSPLAANVTTADHAVSESEHSGLSDLLAPPKADTSPPSSISRPYDTAGDVSMEFDSPETSGNDVRASTEDADYDLASPTLPQTDGAGDDRSSSHDSRPSTKRKSGLDEDEFIMNNPELYGLRRSGRARPTRRIVESSDENEHGSGSDAESGRSRKKRKLVPSAKTSKRATPVVHTSPSVSDSDDYARPSHRGKRQKRRAVVAADSLEPQHLEVRFSTRRAAKPTNYNEEDEDVFGEEDPETVTPNYWAAGADENLPAIDAILRHRLKKDQERELNGRRPSRDDFEFFVKWQGKAHYHATWETTASLTGMRGTRRLENYFRKTVLEDIHMMKDDEIPPEEKEKWNLDRERDSDAINDYMKVERIISTREGDEDTEYYVKWKGLYYDSCTWESAALVSELAQAEIDRFLDRTSRLPVSSKIEANPATRRKFVTIREQPGYIKHGQLRDFQVTGVNFLAYNWCRGNNVVLADEMGLGKTVQTVAFLNWLRHDRHQEGPFLVVVPLSTMPAWAETFDLWTPDINYVVYNGNEASRNIIKEYELLADGNPKRTKFNVLLTTYEYVLADSPYLMQLKWQFMAVDEAHRLKNRVSQLYQKLLEFKTPSRLLITGTPMQNTLGELSSLMEFIMPGAVEVDDDMDLSSEAAGEKLDKLTQEIQPFMLRRTKQKVENDLPPKSEKIIRVELADIQLEYYKNILTRNYAALNQGSKGQKQSLLNIMMELKKASNHAFMFANAEARVLNGSDRREDILKGLISSSGKMMLLNQLLNKLKKDGHRVLIFSQMVKMLDILGDYLHLRGYQFQRLDGTIAAGQRRMAIDHFNAPDSHDFCFLLSTRAGGLGINLMTADTVILFDSDWNPQADLQAMARAHRIGQKNPVTIYRLVSKDTVEEEVLERARNKLMLEFITIQRGVTDKTAKEITDRVIHAGRGISEPTSSEDIDRILKRRGQKMFEQSGNQRKLEELDIDAVLQNAEEHRTEDPSGIVATGGEDFLKTFEYTDVKVDLSWDEIIPQDELATIKAEERRQADAAYLEQVIEQNAPRQRKTAKDEREERAAKKRARDLAAETRETSSDAADADPKRPLSEKELRNLVRAYLRYGALPERWTELVQDAHLVGRDADLLHDTLREITRASERLLREEQARIEALEREAQKVLTKKDKKAILFDYHGVKRLNAETIVERPVEMRMVRDAIAAVPEAKNFRIPEASKAANYSCPWGAREDGMLLLGIHRHGYGAWAPIRDDPTLGLTDRLFLEEHRVDKKEERGKGEDKNAKSPGAVHLVRRADYLLAVLKEKTSHGGTTPGAAARRAGEPHARHGGKKNGTTSAGGLAPPLAKKGSREGEKGARHRTLSHGEHGAGADRRGSHGSGHGGPSEPRDPKRKHGDEEEEERRKRRKSEEHGHSHHRRENGTADDAESVLRNLFKPVRPSLKRVQGATKELVKDKPARAKILRVEILKIGDHVGTLWNEKEGGKDNVALGGRLWDFVGRYWPNQGTPGAQLKGMYERIVAA